MNITYTPISIFQPRQPIAPMQITIAFSMAGFAVAPSWVSQSWAWHWTIPFWALIIVPVGKASSAQLCQLPLAETGPSVSALPSLPIKLEVTKCLYYFSLFSTGEISCNSVNPYPNVNGCCPNNDHGDYMAPCAANAGQTAPECEDRSKKCSSMLIRKKKV